MDQKSLEKNLANMERELLALKTAHDVGLGNVNYWEYNDKATTLFEGVVSYIGVQVKSGEPLNPIMAFYVDTSLVGVDNIMKSQTYSDRYLLYAISLSFARVTYHFKLTSTSQVEYFEIPTGSEAQAWLGTY